MRPSPAATSTCRSPRRRNWRSFIPEFSIFTAGYLLRDAEHQGRSSPRPSWSHEEDRSKRSSASSCCRSCISAVASSNLRQSKAEQPVMTPADLNGVKLRMPGTDAWQFLGRRWAPIRFRWPSPRSIPALQTGAIDGQDNPLPTDKDSKFYEVTKQIVLTTHLVDQNYLAFSKTVWDKLSAEIRQTLQKAADDAADSERAEAAGAGGRARDLLQGPGSRCLRARSRSVPQACAGGLPGVRLLEGLAEGHGRQDQRALIAEPGRGARCRCLEAPAGDWPSSWRSSC